MNPLSKHIMKLGKWTGFFLIVTLTIGFSFGEKSGSSESFINGVNIQGAFRTRVHGKMVREKVINDVAKVINKLGFESIRIGGTSLMGGSFDSEHKGYGWSKYWHIEEVRHVHPKNPYTGEPWNFNRMAIETAAKARVSVWIDFHRYMEKEDMDMALSMARKLGVEVIGITRDNEPYVPERFKFVEAAFREFTEERFDSQHWPIMYFTDGRLKSRKKRELVVQRLFKEYSSPGEGIEMHCYCPIELKEDPEAFIRETIARTVDAYGVSTENIVAGEWSGKNQERWEAEELNQVIEDYLKVFEENGINSYYQILGSENEQSGLWNFRTNTPNRGAEVFMGFAAKRN